MTRSAWQLPPGVSRGTWDYANSEPVATDYDSYFADHAMFRLDREVLDRHLVTGKTVVDLGCGTGRAILPLVQRGLRGVAVDLSPAMLRETQAKRDAENIPDGELPCLRANLADLDCLASESFDYAICLFSTFGMIRGREARHRAFQHAARLLVPGGLLVFQVHNYWAHLFDPEGPWWMLKNLVRSRVAKDVEIGDKFFTYRGVPEMYLHSFTKRYLRRTLLAVGLQIIESVPLNHNQNRKLRWPRVLEGMRASGWILVAAKE